MKRKVKTKNKKTYLKAQRGLSLLELIVVLAIMSSLAGAGYLSMSETKSSTKMETAQRELASEIKLAQAYALQGRMQDNSGTMQTPCGYGVWFNPGRTGYAIYYNFPLSGKTCEMVNGTDSSYRTYSGNSQSLAARTLPAGITLSNNRILAGVYFTVPNARVYWNSSVSDTGALMDQNILTITLTDGTLSKNITVNGSGVIDIAP